MVVTSGRAAADLLAEDTRFDVILCDLMMPDMSGMELYAQLKTSAPDLAPRMIFVTGGAFTARAHEFLDSVPNARVDKPFDLDQLRELLRSRVAANHGG